MRVLVVGSWWCSDYYAVADSICKFKLPITEIVGVCAPGVGVLAEAWAILNGVPVGRFYADWGEEESFDVNAGRRRDLLACAYARALVVVWDGVCHETERMVTRMKNLRRPVYERRIEYREGQTW